jgi:site-specific recombinase
MDHPPTLTAAALARLAGFVDRIRPDGPADGEQASLRLQAELARLSSLPEERVQLRADLLTLLTLENQNALYAEAGVQSALGFGPELRKRVGFHLLPRVPASGNLDDAAALIFAHRRDHLWIEAIPDAEWSRLMAKLGLDEPSPEIARVATATLLDAARVTSYRIAGVGLDRELLRNDPALDRYESPFMAQNVEFLALFAQVIERRALPQSDEIRHLEVLLSQCDQVIERIRRRARDNGTSIRLTYQLARLEQLIERLRLLLAVLFEARPGSGIIRLFKILVRAFNTRDEVRPFIRQNVALLARNVTEHASRHGEHYIAGDRREWWAMFRAGAGGGVIIAAMAAIKLELAQLHLPPLSEGLAFGLNYGLGFALIHMFGLVVATKQPAMTATTLAAALEGCRPREAGRLADLLQDVVRTQNIAIVGNVLLAVPVGCLIALAWPGLFGTVMVSPDKAAALLAELHPLASGALWYAAVAAVGLFLSGLVSGYYDNKVRYLGLAERFAGHPWLAGLGPGRRVRLAGYLDRHYGAIMGNLFFGLYLGLAGSVSVLTGLPVEIRHVAFASANVGTALAQYDFDLPWTTLAWTAAGVVGIGAVNLLVSFTLALRVAMLSRRLDSGLMPGLFGLAGQRLLRRPWTYLLPPAERKAPAAD